MFKSKATIVSIVYGSLLVLAIGSMRSNSSKPHPQPVAKPFPSPPVITQSPKTNTKVANSITPSIETTPIDKSHILKTTSAPEVTATTHWGTLHSNDGKINLRTGPGTVNKAMGYGINGDRVQILNSDQDSGGYTWYKVKFPKSGAIGWIAGQLIEMDSNTDLQTESEPAAQSSIQSSPSQLPQSERFRLRFYEEVDRLAGNFGIKRKYAVMTMQNWETQPEGIELGYKYTCEDMAKFNGDAMAIAQFAYEVNEYSIPLDQLQVFNQAKFEAAKFVGCK